MKSLKKNIDFDYLLKDKVGGILHCRDTCSGELQPEKNKIVAKGGHILFIRF